MPSAPVFFQNARAFRAWLQCHARNAPELLVAFHKVATGRTCMTWTESVDEALCFGWIDGVRRRLDEHAYVIRFTPRQRASIWSAVNIAKVESLRAAGRMTPAGENAFALRSAERSAIYAHEQAAPAELASAELRLFKRQRSAWKFFNGSPLGYRKSVLHWTTSARRRETRAARLSRLIAACLAGERLG
jgi:uncharacterized protein YdeI (YjbR/CyaY-like superfamily)